MKKYILSLIFLLLPIFSYAQTQVETYRLDWTDTNPSTAPNAQNEEGTRIFEKVGSGSYVPIGTVGPDVVTYTRVIPNDPGGVTYTYKIRAFIGSVESADSNEVSITSPIIVPPSPTNLVCSLAPNATGGVITCSFTGSVGATSYDVEKKVDAGAFAFLFNISSTSFQDTFTQGPGTQVRSYRVFARNSSGLSGPSNVIDVTFVVPNPNAPGSVTVIRQ